jgi:GAF domain-containing protein
MADDLKITASSKKEKYVQLLPQVKALLNNETDLIANMANVCAALKFGMDFFWVGFYVINQSELVLGPFQGPVACTRIQKGRGVCGTSWEKAQTIIVEDVDKFPGHIACSSLSKSEIVIPIYNSLNSIIGVLDVDSEELNSFDSTDDFYLNEIIKLIKF